ncbi:MAG: hypothetical protein JNG83_04300 [Opitutaceae bacterium]|nr:hypothetical protein [Opitutaceae bacterium]
MSAAFSSVLILAGLLLPGLGWALGARWPMPWLAAGVLSALAILAGTVGGSLAGIPLSFGTLGAWLAAVALGGAWYGWRRRRPPADDRVDFRGAWLALPAAAMLAVDAWRAVKQPLSGADVDFRWNYLAELMVQSGSLAFYPPVVPADFSRYFWVDGICPLVSSLYAWTYLAAGSLDRHWTALPQLLQVSGLCLLLFRLGSAWGGPRAGWLAVGLGGATFLLHFAFNLGQETGLTALGAGGMAFYLLRSRQDARPALLVPAAACAALAACARDYGFAFGLAGIGGLLLTRAGWRRVAGFGLLALLPAAIWHGRNWVLTGNPFYSLRVGGLFPVNPVFAAWMDGYAEIYGQPLRHAEGLREFARLVAISALPAAAGLLAGGWHFRRRADAYGLLLVAGAAGACWLASVPYTAGGLFYSMRVLSPLLVVGCAWGGAALAAHVDRRSVLAALTAGLTILGADAALRTWTVPSNPYRLAPREWPEAGYRMQLDFERGHRPFLLAAATLCHGRVLSESAGAQRVFAAAGRELNPIWSPEVAFLFGPDGAPDAARRLRALGYTHVLLTRVQSSVDFLARHGALARLDGHLRSVMANDTFVLFALEPQREPAP